MALQRFLDLEAPSIVVALNQAGELQEEITKMISAHYLPHKAVVWRRENDEALRDLTYSSRDKKPIDGKTTLYICFRDRCAEPITDISLMWHAFETLK